MKPFNLFPAVLTVILILPACGGPRREEAPDVYEEGYLRNDDMVAFRSSDGTLTFKNTETHKVTIKGLDLDWTQTSPYDSLAVFSSGGKRGYYNVYTGEIVIPAQYRRAWIFRDGLAAVQKNGHIGFINHRGDVMIDFDFPYHGNPLSSFVFEDGHCVVADKNGKCGVIDYVGGWIILPEYDHINTYKEYAIATRNGITVQMDYYGNVINSFVLDNIKELTYDEEIVYETKDGEIGTTTCTVKTGLFAYCIGGRYGLLDGSTFTRLTEPLYKNIYALSKTLFRAYLLDYSSEVILNEKGEVLK